MLSPVAMRHLATVPLGAPAREYARLFSAPCKGATLAERGKAGMAKWVRAMLFLSVNPERRIQLDWTEPQGVDAAEFRKLWRAAIDRAINARAVYEPLRQRATLCRYDGRWSARDVRREERIRESIAAKRTYAEQERRAANPDESTLSLCGTCSGDGYAFRVYRGPNRYSDCGRFSRETLYYRAGMFGPGVLAGPFDNVHACYEAARVALRKQEER